MGIEGSLTQSIFVPKIISLDNQNWTRVDGFGKLYHLLKNNDNYTVCGYDISLFEHKRSITSPKTKCNRCIQIIKINEAKLAVNF